MNVLDGFSATGTQTVRTADDHGNTITLTLRFNPATAQWFLDVKWKDFVLYGLRLSNSANSLWPYRKLLGWGLAVLLPDDSDPFLINDFSTGRAELAILSSDELDQVDDYYQGRREL